jgi:hypothetical protein
MRTRTPQLLEGDCWAAISQKPERRDHLPANVTAVGCDRLGSEFQMVRTEGGDSPQDVKKFYAKTWHYTFAK